MYSREPIHLKLALKFSNGNSKCVIFFINCLLSYTNLGVFEFYCKTYKPAWSTQCRGHFQGVPTLSCHKEPPIAQVIQKVPISVHGSHLSLYILIWNSHTIKIFQPFEALDQWEPSLDIAWPMRVDHAGWNITGKSNSLGGKNSVLCPKLTFDKTDLVSLQKMKMLHFSPFITTESAQRSFKNLFFI